MHKLTPDIDLDAEVSALAKYIALKWSPIPELEALFREIRNIALADGRTCFDRHALIDTIHDLLAVRGQLLEESLGNEHAAAARYYDHVMAFLSEVCTNADRVAECGRNYTTIWDYSRRVNRLYGYLAGKFPELSRAKPNGWDALRKGYNDFDGQAEYDPAPDQALFEGVDVQPVTAYGFVGATALPYVMYDEVCQGRSAARVLVAAAYTHFLLISDDLNAMAIGDELKALANAPAEMVFELDRSSENPFMKVFFALCRDLPTKEDYLQSVESRRQYDALSPEEKEARRIASEKAMLEMVRQIKEEDGDFRDRLEARARQTREALQSVFGTTIVAV